ncbi:hypothetical protein ACQKEF_24235 [Pseudomonas oryzihabitans]|uniref:hypothetical protein n=1 Tax=Pseudomonas oryzihabitans TaxID=47885 RepID=UPI003D06954C
MSFFDSVFDFVDRAAGTVSDLAVATVDAIGDLASSAVDTVTENPGKTALVCLGTLATGGAAVAFAGPIAAVVGSTGLLGATASGTAISSLSGVALTNASLAALGGGAIAAGGGGMAAGVTVVGWTGAAVGASVGVGAAAGAAGAER